MEMKLITLDQIYQVKLNFKMPLLVPDLLLLFISIVCRDRISSEVTGLLRRDYDLRMRLQA